MKLEEWEKNRRNEEFKKNNEHKSVSNEACEDTINRKKEKQKYSKEERRERGQEKFGFQKSAEKLQKERLNPLKLGRKKEKAFVNKYRYYEILIQDLKMGYKQNKISVYQEEARFKEGKLVTW